jgi:2-polyprenyl-6-methoxyphenol hydroxylase-like FAD-dependent oxidoreductase
MEEFDNDDRVGPPARFHRRNRRRLRRIPHGDIPDLERAFTAFESHRRPRVEKLVREARRQGGRKAAANPLSRRVRDLMLPFFLELGMRSLRDVYRYRVDWRDRAA